VAESKNPAIGSTLWPTNTAKKKWIVLAAVLTVAFVWFGQRRVAAGRANSESPGQVNAVLHLEPFVVNLADPEEKAYLRVGIDLGLREEVQKDSGALPTALVRDTLLSVLTSCDPNQLLTVEGKSKLREDLLQAVQKRAPGLGVNEVYFTEFLIQR
jgi:flagellar FliL protein